MISYDLQRPGQNYPELFDAIKSVGTTWWHCLESVWLVKTTLASAQVREQLRLHIDANDKILVAALAGNWASLGLKQECNDWLSENLAR
jgi:hypothetical protein